jgi:hypothetical protein
MRITTTFNSPRGSTRRAPRSACAVAGHATGNLFEHLSTLAGVSDIIAFMAGEERHTWGPGSSLGYAIVLLGAALFVTSCFLPYYGFQGGGSVSQYDQLMVRQDGGLELGAILLLFGGVTTVVVVAIVGLARGKRDAGPVQFLAGSVAAWSLTWIGSLLQSASLREGETIPGGLTLEMGFWLQAVSIGVAVIGTILVATRRVGDQERHADGSRRESEASP